MPPCCFFPSRASRLERVLREVVWGEQTARVEQPASPPQRLAAYHPLRILLAEDNRVNQLVVVRMLRSLGYTPTVVDNGRGAIEALRATPYDVVLMDMQMPDMDGLEATRIIRRELPSDRQPRVVALTANVLDEHVHEFHDAGADGFLAKPITLDKLAGVLKDAEPSR